MIEAPTLARTGAVRHGFLTRAGGVSDGPFSSLNCGFSSGDDPGRVAENRAIALRRAGLAPASLAAAHQVHGTDVLTVSAPAPDKPRRRADALVTDRAGVTLGVLSADCAPVLLVDPEAGVIGAAHAGWRGAQAGIVEATLAAMAALGALPARMVAAVGPCIAQPSYEVGPELLREFAAADAGCAALFAPVGGTDRLLFDLKGYVVRRLARAGIGVAEALPHDTAADEARFFSARRSRRRGEERFGLLLSVIALRP